MAETAALNPKQANALFDILTHHETYAEIEDFKDPATIHHYGPPFQDDKQTESPILQMLLSKFVLRLPGMRDVEKDFWKVRVESLIEDLSAAELSESYDKGVLGIRKTLATAVSALIEYPARGCLGAFPKVESAFAEREYDNKNPDDVLDAFNAFLQQLVYGDLFDTLYAKAAETDDLTKHPSLVQAAHEFVVVNLASFMHYTLVLSPEGPSLLRMVENVHKLLPYGIIRQTLRIGNVATMISGMMKIILAKMSLGSVTNWLGVSSGADEGMNLLQQIMSTVLGWDKSELKKRLDKLKKDPNAPSKKVQTALRDWTNASRQEHLETRNRSRDQSMSIVSTILSLSSASPDLTEAQHTKALEYLSLSLSIRDRDEIIRVLCKHNPDHLTQAIRDAVSAYEPMIRQVHQAADLSATVGDVEAFINDMIKMSKQGKSDGKKTSVSTQPPSVEDYVDLLHRHQGATHRFLHQVAKNGKEVTKWFQDYCDEAAKEFQVHESKEKEGKLLMDAVSDLLATLSDQDRKRVTAEIDAHSTYLDTLHASSAARVRDVIAKKSATAYGPGAYLARWQGLLDSTPITPDKPQGPVRKGGSRGVKGEARKDVDGEVKDVGIGEKQAEKVVADKTPAAPSVDLTVGLLGKRFRELLVRKL